MKYVIAFAMLASSCGPDKQWEAFKIAHHCKVIGRADDQTGFTSNGHAVYISGTTTWKCDDGVSYTKED